MGYVVVFLGALVAAYLWVGSIAGGLPLGRDE